MSSGEKDGNSASGEKGVISVSGEKDVISISGDRCYQCTRKDAISASGKK